MLDVPGFSAPANESEVGPETFIVQSPAEASPPSSLTTFLITTSVPVGSFDSPQSPASVTVSLNVCVSVDVVQPMTTVTVCSPFV